jgi:predicted DNA-binding protein (UPF0278 family)
MNIMDIARILQDFVSSVSRQRLGRTLRAAEWTRRKRSTSSLEGLVQEFILKVRRALGGQIIDSVRNADPSLIVIIDET